MGVVLNKSSQDPPFTTLIYIYIMYISIYFNDVIPCRPASAWESSASHRSSAAEALRSWSLEVREMNRWTQRPQPTNSRLYQQSNYAWSWFAHPSPILPPSASCTPPCHLQPLRPTPERLAPGNRNIKCGVLSRLNEWMQIIFSTLLNFISPPSSLIFH